MLNEPTRKFIRENAHVKNIHSLLLLKNIPNDVDIQAAIQQIEGKRKAVVKYPALADSKDFIFPDKLAIEQASSEKTALYKSQLTGKCNNMIDITGGMGIDCIYFSMKIPHVTYVEINKSLFEIAQHNFSSLSLPITCINENSMHYLSRSKDKYDWLYTDPARRNPEGKKVFRINECEPDISGNLQLLFSKASQLMIKLSPMLDITQGISDLAYSVSDVHIVSIDNECKELLFICQNDTIDNPSIHCVNITKSGEEVFVFCKQEEENAANKFADSIQSYLYEPNVAVLKSGAFKLLCNRFGLVKLHVNTHLYTSDELRHNFPGRVFRVEHVFPLNESSLKQYLPEKKANITVRNFPLSVAQIRKKYKIKEGGEVYLFATSFGKFKQVILCKKEGRKI